MRSTKGTPIKREYYDYSSKNILSIDTFFSRIKYHSSSSSLYSNFHLIHNTSVIDIMEALKEELEEEKLQIKL